MPTYLNIRPVEVYVTDELGLPTKFLAAETKTGCSAYFERYTTGEDPVLRRTSAETYVDEVVPAVRNENMVFLPGSTAGSTHELATDAVYNTTTAKRLKRVVLDPTTDTALRQIKTDYLGFTIVAAAISDAATAYGVYMDTTGNNVYFVLEDSDGTKKAFSIALTPVVLS